MKIKIKNWVIPVLKNLWKNRKEIKIKLESGFEDDFETDLKYFDKILRAGLTKKQYNQILPDHEEIIFEYFFDFYQSKNELSFIKKYLRVLSRDTIEIT